MIIIIRFDNFLFLTSMVTPKYLKKANILFLADFLPVFKVLDLATGQVDQFHGKYGLKIVGGGPTYQSVTDYSQEEQTKYNYQTTR